MARVLSPRVVPYAVFAVILAVAVAVDTYSRPASSQPRVGGDPDTTAITPAMISAGRTIFHGKGTCFACHGANLQGTPGVAPTLLAHTWKDARNGDYRAIIGVVSHGVPGTAMVAFPGGISPTEVPVVAAYIWEASRGKVKP
ncbi:MAG: c-type cytochrome [Gemmatimonadaceae bacterium]